MTAWLPQSWSDWGGCALVVQALILFVSLLYAKGALREASNSRHLQAVREILREIGGEDIRAARTWVLKNMDVREVLKEGNEEQLKTARRVAVCMDRVAYMVSQNLIPDHPLYVWQQDEIEKLWENLKPVVMFVQQNGRPHYCCHFKYLAEEWFPKMKIKYGNVPAGHKP